jgi:Uma2 family endonuclease
MSHLQTELPMDTWIVATWDEYTQAIANPIYQKAKGYYHDGQLRIEISPIGPDDHSRNHTIILFAVNLFGTIKAIPLNGLDNCTYRKEGIRECQPDVSYYIGEQAKLAPQGSSVVDLAQNPPPDLTIEVANTSLADDIGQKRLLYENLGIAEYWVVDVQNVRVIAFAIANGGSKRITQSQVLPGLKISLLEAAL